MKRYSMKHIVMIFMYLLILILNYAHADDLLTQYHVSYTEVSISLPVGSLFADRNVTDNDHICLSRNLTRKEILEEYLDDDYYAIAIFGNNVIYVQYKSSIWSDYSTLVDPLITLINSSRIDDLISDGYEVISSGVYTYNIPYFKYIYDIDPSDHLLCYCYVTTYNNSEYKFTFLDNDQYNKNDEDYFDSLVRSIVYDNSINNTNSLDSLSEHSIKCDDFSLLVRDEYEYTTRYDNDLNNTEQYIFNHDYYLKALVSYGGFSADIKSYPRTYNTSLSDNECITEILKYANGGFSNLQTSITISRLGNYSYIILGKDDLHPEYNLEFDNVYVFHKNGIVSIDAHNKIDNENQRNNFVSFLLDLADSIVPLEKMPEDKE